jgi:hypothetical protein
MRNLKRDIEYGLRDGLYFEPTRVSDKLLSTILPNWKIRRAAVRFRWHVAPFQVPVPQRRFPPPWSVEETDVCFIVRDANGRRSPTSIRGRPGTAHLLTRDEATPARGRIGSQEARPPLTNHLRA